MRLLVDDVAAMAVLLAGKRQRCVACCGASRDVEVHHVVRQPDQLRAVTFVPVAKCGDVVFGRRIVVPIAPANM